jgi:hypothetical protein
MLVFHNIDKQVLSISLWLGSSPKGLRNTHLREHLNEFVAELLRDISILVE